MAPDQLVLFLLYYTNLALVPSSFSSPSELIAPSDRVGSPSPSRTRSRSTEKGLRCDSRALKFVFPLVDLLSRVELSFLAMVTGWSVGEVGGAKSKEHSTASGASVLKLGKWARDQSAAR